MSSIAEIVEQFILKTMGENDSVEISRNALASYFSCAPSQINYVLDTRFTTDKGFLKESKRGGNGFIKISKIHTAGENEYLNELITDSVGDELTFKRMTQINYKLISEKIITNRERMIIEESLSDDSLEMPFTIKNKVRAKAFKNVLLKLMLK